MSKSNEKFLFNLHNFDDEDQGKEELIEDTQEDLPPPPPVFTEEELEAAKKQAYEEGYQKAQDDSRVSREQMIKASIQTLVGDVQVLLAAEQEREKRFEIEAVYLAQEIFTKLFPGYAASHGFGETANALEHAVQMLHPDTNSRIEILAASDDFQAIEAYFKEHAEGVHIDIKASPALASGQCEIRWVEGGFMYDSRQLATEVGRVLEQGLARAGHVPREAGDIKQVSGDVLPEEYDTMHADGADIASGNEVPEQEDAPTENEAVEFSGDSIDNQDASGDVVVKDTLQNGEDDNEE